MDAVNWSEVIRNYAIVIGGGIGLALAAWRSMAANKQAEASLDQAYLARRGHIAELFSQAVERLGQDRLEIRLGAIYTLREICRDFPEYSDPMFELLSAHLRESTRDENFEQGVPVDIAEIMSFLRAELRE